MNSIKQPAVYLALGAVLGLVVGLNAAGLWPQVPLHAMATHGQDNFAIATGLMDERAEAIFYLDFLTGELKAAVLDPQIGKFNAFFAHNVAADFPAATQNPRYAMVTGLADLPRGRQSFGRSALYIAEGNSGQIACYAIPWNEALASRRATQAGPFILLDRRQFRTTAIRD
ncbi:MAG: hypothetical protein WDZ59_15255 [Pirellulales bacterium]|jgi:hypothetical protein